MKGKERFFRNYAEAIKYSKARKKKKKEVCINTTQPK